MEINKIEIRTKLTDAIKNCKQISLNGVAYFGKLGRKNKETGVTELTDAILAEDSLLETVKSWIRAYNINDLCSLEITGDTQVVTKSLTATQKDEIEITIIQVSNIIANTIPMLINQQIK